MRQFDEIDAIKFHFFERIAKAIKMCFGSSGVKTKTDHLLVRNASVTFVSGVTPRNVSRQTNDGQVDDRKASARDSIVLSLGSFDGADPVIVSVASR